MARWKYSSAASWRAWRRAMREAALAGLYVAAGDEIVRAAEGRFRLLQQTHGFVEFALLERQPTLQHLHDGGHGWIAGIKRQPFALNGQAEGVVVAADAAEAAGGPE